MRSVVSSFGRMAAIFFASAILFGFIGLGIRWSVAPDPLPQVEARPVAPALHAHLVDAAWLADTIERGESSLVIVDLSDPIAYNVEHIPGAIHAWWQDTMDPHAAGYGAALRIADNPFTLPPFAPDVGALPNDTIVVYDNTASEHAARVAWWLRASGYPNAVVLDGGLPAWKGAGHATSGEAEFPKAIATPEPSWDSAYWDERAEIRTDELRDRLGDPGLVLIDTRTPAQARDTINDTIPLGRIPGSRSLPPDAVMRDDGTFASPEELTDILEPLQIKPEDEIVLYGRFGVDTGRVWLALRLAGYENVRVYDGGWQAWASTPDLPTEPLP